MNTTQIKAGFKKEWLQYMRTFRFWGVLIAILSFGIADPLMYKSIAVMMSYMPDMLSASLIPAAASMAGEMAGGDVFEQMTALYNNAGIIYSVTLSGICTGATLVCMLILMSPAGGERKKRATIIPAASGLDYFNYLLPKYVIYPCTIFAASFVAAVAGGFLCKAMFTEGVFSVGTIMLASLLAAVYCVFIIAVYITLGVCTSRPGIATVSVYFGANITQVLLQGFELSQYNPFTLLFLVTGDMFSEEFVLADNIASIAVAIVLSIVISVLLFFLASTVLKANKINNQEDRPEF